MKKIVSGVLAGTLLLLFLPGTALAGPTVTVRVEGASTTLLERTTVTLPDTPPFAGCPRWTAAAALEEATRGDWDRAQLTQTILGESHTFTDSDYWAEWVDRGEGYAFGTGVCADVLDEGDELLMLVDRSPAPAFAPTVFPLDLVGLPATVAAGTTVALTVVQYKLTGMTVERVPVAAASVAGAGIAATTAADGTAGVRLDQPGTVVLKATAPGAAPSAAEVVTVTAAAAPGTPAPTPAPPAGGEAPDSVAPRATIARLRAGATYPVRRAPRLLRGSVVERGSGIRSVQLSIVRRGRPTCAAWGVKKERFVRRRCGKAAYFTVSRTARWSYLLPERLPAGRYSIRVAAVDEAGNRASTGVVFRVR